MVTRIAIGKDIGFLVGLIGFISLPFFLPEAGWLIRWGILLWYTTLGAIIGVFTWHPVLKLPMPWWMGGHATNDRGLAAHVGEPRLGHPICRAGLGRLHSFPN